MNQRRAPLALVAMFLGLFIALFVPIPHAKAAGTCQAPTNHVEAITVVPLSGNFALYVHIENGGLASRARMEARDTLTQKCYHIVPQKMLPENDDWYNAVLQDPGEGDLFDLHSAIWNNLGTDAVIDKVMFSNTNPICAPTAGGPCKAQNGEDTTIFTPYPLSDEGDAIAISLSHLPDASNIQEVVTYIDDKEAYRLPYLSAVDMRYMRAGDHKVERRVIYKDGSTTSYRTTVHSESEDVINYYFVYLLPHAHLAKNIGMVVGALLCFWVVLFGVRAVHRQYLWRKEHNMLDL